MNTKVNEREQDREKQSRNMSDLKPGRSAMPPAFGLTASKPGPAGGNLLSASIGRKGENRPEDLIRFGKYLQSIGAPPVLIAEAVDPSRNGDLIAKYQKQVMKFRNPDGRIDPGGKTETAIREQRGRETVAGWYRTKPKEAGAPKAAGKDNDESQKLPEGESWIISPLMSKSDYITQAPPKEAGGARTLTKTQLFSLALKDYGPGQVRDIEKKENWPRHTRWNHKKYGHWKDYDGALRATHWLSCHNTCIYMAQSAGVSGVGHNADYNKKMKASDVKGKTAEMLIDAQLEKGLVVVVRVDGHHSILIIGKGQDEKGKYYVFFDPGRTGTKGHNLKNNRLYISEKSIKNDRYRAITSVRQSTPKNS